MGDFVEVEVAPGRIIKDDQGYKVAGQTARVPDFQYRPELGKILKGKPAPQATAQKMAKQKRAETNFEAQVEDGE